jgi:prepilin-type N-terminal cleavage/methylation domain-containing protein
MATRRGFSLVEMLVVLAIIGVLTGLLLPALQAARTRALEIQCKNNLRQFDIGVSQQIEGGGQFNLHSQAWNGIGFCPIRRALDEAAGNEILGNNYLFIFDELRKSCTMIDAPLEMKSPYLGPEMTYREVISLTGPHTHGFYFTNTSMHGVRFVVAGEIID